MTYALASALSRGGKFILSPPAPTPYEDYVTGFEGYRRTIRLRATFGDDSGDNFDPRYHVPNRSWQPGRAPGHIEAQLRKLHTHLESRFAGDKITPLVSNVARSERVALYDIRQSGLDAHRPSLVHARVLPPTPRHRYLSGGGGSGIRCGRDQSQST